MSLLTEQIITSLQDKAIAEKTAFLSGFFKSGPGEYGEGDQFLGVTVPDQRKVAKACFKEISLEEVSQLLENPFHEVRLTALILLVYRYQKLKSDSERLEIVNFYLLHLDFVNNWDFVDCSCHHIIGNYYWQKDISLFYGLADSGQLWRQRVAMISSYFWIKKGEFGDALDLAENLKNHPYDLIHKAVGWMLREIGNKDFNAEYEFLRKQYQSMPRTALRYSIEKFPEELRQDFLKGKVLE